MYETIYADSYDEAKEQYIEEFGCVPYVIREEVEGEFICFETNEDLDDYLRNEVVGYY